MFFGQAPHGRQLFAAVLFVASTVVLTMQLINPSPIVVSVGENGTEVAQLSGYFTHLDVSIIAVAATLLGATGMYILVGDTASGSVQPARSTASGEQSENLEPSEELLESRRQEWEETAEYLANNERAIYEAILEEDGVIAQSDIVERTDCSKATVSRSLDSLETTLFGRLAELAEYIDGDAIYETVDRCPSKVQ